MSLAAVTTDSTDELLHGPLSRAGAKGLAILSGAGTSMIGRTRLPSGPDLLRRALEMLVTDARLIDRRDHALEDERIHTLVPEVIFQRFHDILGELPTDLYEPFRSARPNGAHALLADLASRGAFMATANFDLAIERAAVERHLRLPPDSPLHLHGRADDPRGLIHTIRAVGRGLPTEIEALFQAGLRGRHLVVMGYSGNDREIMEAIVKARPRKITWLIRASDDWALTNLERWRPALPAVDVMITDLQAIDIAEGGPKGDSSAPMWPATPNHPPSPLEQLEILLALLLQLQRYAEAAEAASVADDLEGTVENLASIVALSSFATRRSGNVTGALTAGKRAMTLARGTKLGMRARACTETALACLDLEPPRTHHAEKLLLQAKNLLEQAQLDEPSDVVDSLLASAEHNLGFAAESSWDYERALTHYSQGLAMKKRIGDLPYQVSSERDVALMLILLDRKKEADPHLRRFIGLAETYADPYELAYFDLALGRHRLHQRRPDEARAPLVRAAEAFEALGDHGNAMKAERWLESMDDGPNAR